MTADDGSDTERVDVDIDGMALEDAVDAVVAAGVSSDPEQVREALEYATEDGVVTQAALDEERPVVTRNVSNASEQAMEARLALTKARETAEPVADLETVARRLDTYERRVGTLAERTERLEARHDALTDRIEDPDSLYAVAEGIRTVVEEAQRIEARALGFRGDIEELEADLHSPEAWVNDIQQDLNAVEETLDAIEAAAAALPAEDADVEDDWDWADRDVDPAVVWFDATLRVEHAAPLLADLRVEMDDLQAWGERESEFETWYADSVAADLEELADRRTELAARLDALARPAWSDRFADRLDSFESDLADLDSPVDWAELQAALDAYRPDDMDT